MAEAYVWPELRGRGGPAEVAPEEIRQRAREEGYAAGREQGLEDGRREAQAEVASMREQLAAALSRVDTTVYELRERDLTMLTGVVHSLCRNLLGWELRTSPEALEQMLADALTQLEVSPADVDAYLHPDDHGWLQSLYHGAVRLHADAQVPRGGVSVRTAAQAADFDPQSLLDSLFDDVRHDLTG